MDESIPSSGWPAIKSDLSQRIREIRQELYGEHGGPLVAEALRIPFRTWLNYESGVVVPAVLVLRLIVLRGVNPSWLLSGQGKKYER